MTDSNGSRTPQGREPRRCPEELSDLVDFMARLILLVVVVVGPALVFVWLALSSFGRGRGEHEGAPRFGSGVASVVLDTGRAVARSWAYRSGALA